MEETRIVEIGANRSKRLIGAAAFAAALGGGALFGFALGSPTASSAQTPETTTTVPDGSEAAPDGDRGPRDCGPGRHGGAGLDAAATALGMTADELRTELRAGKSIADVAGERGVDVQTVIDAMVAEASAHIDEAVADGKLSAEQATERKADLEARITEQVNQVGPPPGADGPGGHHGRGGPALDAAATALEMTADELRTELRAGKSIADVAGEKGVDVQTVIDAMVAEASAHIDEAVADGKLSAEQATERKADLEARITDLVNNGFPPGGPGHRGPGGPGGPGGPWG